MVIILLFALLNNKYTVKVIAIALDSIDVEFIHGDIKYKGRIKAENLQHDIGSYKLGTTINAKIINNLFCFFKSSPVIFFAITSSS